MTGHKTGFVQIAPYFRQVLFLDAEQVDALTASDFHGGDLVFLRHIGNRSQFLRVGDPAPDARHDGIGSVFLDIGMSAFVDIARLRVVLVFAGPSAQ